MLIRINYVSPYGKNPEHDGKMVSFFLQVNYIRTLNNLNQTCYKLEEIRVTKKQFRTFIAAARNFLNRIEEIFGTGNGSRIGSSNDTLEFLLHRARNDNLNNIFLGFTSLRTL